MEKQRIRKVPLLLSSESEEERKRSDECPEKNQLNPLEAHYTKICSSRVFFKIRKGG